MTKRNTKGKTLGKKSSHRNLMVYNPLKLHRIT